MYTIAYFSEKLPEYVWLITYNPLATVIESVRFILLNTGTFDAGMLIYTIVITVITLILGIIIFNKAEKSFIDTV